ncbi:unnamed protein product [Periconia digitata]|uniref:Carboxylic ester hydrolase n=1 Tax=Periconia digitata TaxID=1303443 RepID=A0A9W4UI31_9PLEO|nr:unnamed protein product [Periconia digitata]
MYLRCYLYSLLILALYFFTITSSYPTRNDSITAALSYGTFQGAYSPTYNLTYFRKIPFAASTAGRNRFRGPQPPPRLENGTIYNTDQAFDMCPQRTVNGSEDCLYLGVYSRPWDASTPQKLRPVLLTFYGGGFVQGSATFAVPPSGFPVLNVSASNDYVVVYSNYRTNVFGFLSGHAVAGHPETDLNVGLLDQRAALEWIRDHIYAFGGDAGNVTVWGQSAGGGSVVAQTIAAAAGAGEGGKKLFSKAMTSSPFWPKTYRYDSPENEALYEAVVAGVDCKRAEGKDEIACLKSVDVQRTFTWGPVIDDGFLTKPLSEVVSSGEVDAELIMTSYNLHEGENFVPPGFLSVDGEAGFNSSVASFDSWLAGYLPGFSPEELEQVKQQYSIDGTAEGISWNTTYERAGLIYRDLVLACPAYWLSSKAREGWLVEYTISPAKHASDTIYVSPNRISRFIGNRADSMW